MRNVHTTWPAGDGIQSLDMVYVQGTGGQPYPFGEEDAKRSLNVGDFFIATVPATQALWTHIMGAGNNPACVQGDRRPVENVTWDDLHAPDGFLERINASELLSAITEQLPAKGSFRFRLPSEAEWEYAARGGPHQSDFRFSGSDDIEAVAWYKDNGGNEMHEVGLKAANALGLYDMSGNVWEWCQDCYSADVGHIPEEGSPLENGDDRRILRGGCFHNWAVHCTASKRYEIGRMYGDGCIGFRLALANGG